MVFDGAHLNALGNLCSAFAENVAGVTQSVLLGSRFCAESLIW